MSLIKHITNKDYESANKVLEENFKLILENKLHEMKKMCAATMEQNTHDERMKRLKVGVLEQETYDAATGASSRRTSNTSKIRINKYGDEKKPEDPDEEGDETHMIRQTKTDTDHNAGSSSQSLTTRMSSKVIRPDKGDGKGGDYEVKSDDNFERSSTTKPRGPYKTDPYIDNVTPVSEQDEPPAVGSFRPLNIPKNMPSDEDIRKSTEELKRSTSDPGGFQQQQRLRSGTSQLAEDEIEEEDFLLKVARKKLKPRKPLARANAAMKEEVEQLDEAPRVGIVKLRVRGGQVQRRKKVSNVPGMTLRGGKLTRMSPAERRRRKLGAKKAARKAKTKKFQALRKRKMSLLKRARLGG